MLEVSRRAANASKWAKGFKLDDHLKALGLPMKTGSGALAPQWYQEGKIGTLIDYCMNDVTQERSLFEHIYLNGTVANEYQPTPYAVDLPAFKKFGG